MSMPAMARPVRRGLQLLTGLAVLAALAGCASHQPQVSATQEAARYAARAKRSYTPPGPPGDPWGPYIGEAAQKYDMPEQWIRAVMRQESGGRLYENGQLITSGAGAMGLMQVMPETYDELRQRYALGDDPYDPHDNIMAGTAYMRELYDLYGSPGFLAAYNAGPRRLDDYLTRNRSLPDETRNYVARIGPNLAGAYPQRLSPASQYAMNQIPIVIPPGPRYPRNRGPQPAPVALAANTTRGSGYGRGEVQMAALPEPPRQAPPPPAPPVSVASARAGSGGGLHLIGSAYADTLPAQRGGPSTGGWAIQVGAFASEGLARSAAQSARTQIALASATPFVGTVKQPKGTLYRARLTGLSRDAAVQACEKLSRRGTCMVVSPEAQS